MITMRLGAILLLATLAGAQQTSSPMSAESSIPEPELPVIDYKACPGEGRVVHDWKIKRNVRIYSSWRDKRTIVGTLKAGEKVTVLAGVNVIREPSRALIKRGGGESLAQNISLNPGDMVLLYGFRASGDYDFWAKGVWFTESHEEVA